MQVPDRWWNKFADKELTMHNRDPDKENLGHVRAALAMCENIDWNVGRLLKKLDDLKLANDTIVVYFCDNGPNGYRWNGGMKGRKGSTDEGGVRSPLLIRWPGHIKAVRKVSQIGAAIDLLPTLAELAGLKVASKKSLDGPSLEPLLVSKKTDWPDRMIFSHWRGRVSVRTQQHRFGFQGKLFDMTKDPGQDKDIAKQQPQIASRLSKAVDNWKRDVLDSGKDDRPFLIGHHTYKYTQIPARDGIPHGNIKRSNRFPNNSYFTNWTSTKDKITWNATVAAAGTYEVEIHYACKKADVGATVELSFNDSRLQATIDTAYDPPIRGGEHDRVKRQESYVRDFKSLKLGTIKLKKGPGQLTLRALKVPGSQVMDFRLLLFTRVETKK